LPAVLERRAARDPARYIIANAFDYQGQKVVELDINNNAVPPLSPGVVRQGTQKIVVDPYQMQDVPLKKQKRMIVPNGMFTAQTMINVPMNRGPTVVETPTVKAQRDADADALAADIAAVKEVERQELEGHVARQALILGYVAEMNRILLQEGPYDAEVNDRLLFLQTEIENYKNPEWEINQTELRLTVDKLKTYQKNQRDLVLNLEQKITTGEQTLAKLEREYQDILYGMYDQRWATKVDKIFAEKSYTNTLEKMLTKLENEVKAMKIAQENLTVVETTINAEIGMVGHSDSLENFQTTFNAACQEWQQHYTTSNVAANKVTIAFTQYATLLRTKNEVINALIDDSNKWRDQVDSIRLLALVIASNAGLTPALVARNTANIVNATRLQTTWQQELDVELRLLRYMSTRVDMPGDTEEIIIRDYAAHYFVLPVPTPDEQLWIDRRAIGAVVGPVPIPMPARVRSFERNLDLFRSTKWVAILQSLEIWRGRHDAAQVALVTYTATHTLNLAKVDVVHMEATKAYMWYLYTVCWMYQDQIPKNEEINELVVKREKLERAAQAVLPQMTFEQKFFDTTTFYIYILNVLSRFYICNRALAAHLQYARDYAAKQHILGTDDIRETSLIQWLHGDKFGPIEPTLVGIREMANILLVNGIDAAYLNAWKAAITVNDPRRPRFPAAMAMSLKEVYTTLPVLVLQPVKLSLVRLLCQNWYLHPNLPSFAGLTLARVHVLISENFRQTTIKEDINKLPVEVVIQPNPRSPPQPIKDELYFTEGVHSIMGTRTEVFASTYQYDIIFPAAPAAVVGGAIVALAGAIHGAIAGAALPVATQAVGWPIKMGRHIAGPLVVLPFDHVSPVGHEVDVRGIPYRVTEEVKCLVIPDGAGPESREISQLQATEYRVWVTNYGGRVVRTVDLLLTQCV